MQGLSWRAGGKTGKLDSAETPDWFDLPQCNDFGERVDHPTAREIDKIAQTIQLFSSFHNEERTINFVEQSSTVAQLCNSGPVPVQHCGSQKATTHRKSRKTLDMHS